MVGSGESSNETSGSVKCGGISRLAKDPLASGGGLFHGVR